ncbi:MAG: iron transporter substrate-binding protein [Chthoniobacteraceae bacterium]|nr:iron transporter substrate-binding protein [Chthoniobacteraceae bacterium]
MAKNLLLILALIVTVLVPVALRPKQTTGSQPGARTLVIVTPHNESIRYEFRQAFETYYAARTGQKVRVDYRTPGGTSEIARYVNSEYSAAFEYYWTRKLNKNWSSAVERAFANPRISTESGDSVEQEARRAFLASNVSCGLDLFFGGGALDFQSQAGAGYLVDNGFIAAHPELFNQNSIPQTVSGEPFWDPQGRWIGTVISSFGICSNTDALQRRGIGKPPERWTDLADPRYFGSIALANPSQSGSVNKAIEMLIQQQIQEEIEARRVSGDAVAEGWARAMRLIMRIAANARYFTDLATKIPLDVAAGDAAAGMTIDFYGRFQSEAMRRPDGSSPVQYVNAAAGTSIGVDPIGLFRGAPNADVAREFIGFVLSEEGQRLWNWKPGTPGGPLHYALRRLPILPALYANDFKKFRSDPDINPYESARTFVYNGKWTGTLFRSIAFSVRVMCIDSHDELVEAWRALIDARFPPEATAAFSNVEAVDYKAASGPIREALGPNKIAEVRLARELADRFRAQYRAVTALARAGR